MEYLYKLFSLRGIPEDSRSDDEPEFTAKVIRIWLKHLEVKPLFI
jgi:hypothetical protein